ncbi:MAG: class I SAM-dependent methyltransferase [Candidatus Bathyarchaeota archaeon]|nr:class I SAM-dependent methyltransferase [Candidatus Bathyarchaeota archaeon]
MNLTVNVFDEMGIYWAEIADKSQTEKQLQFLKSHLKPEGYVLDVACGTGRHSIPLSRQGYRMVGLDVSANLLRIAKQRWREVQLVRGDMRFLPFKTRTFAAAISMDTSFGYLPSEQDDLLILTELREVLGKNGVLAIDVFNKEQLKQKFKSAKSSHFEYPSFFLFQKRKVNQNGDRLCDFWVVCDKATGREVTFEHVVRLYERSRLQSLLEMAGFVVKRVYGGYDGEKFSSNSSRLIFVADVHKS